MSMWSEPFTEILETMLPVNEKPRADFLEIARQNVNEGSDGVGAAIRPVLVAQEFERFRVQSPLLAQIIDAALEEVDWEQIGGAYTDWWAEQVGVSSWYDVTADHIAPMDIAKRLAGEDDGVVVELDEEEDESDDDDDDDDDDDEEDEESL